MVLSNKLKNLFEDIESDNEIETENQTNYCHDTFILKENKFKIDNSQSLKKWIWLASH